jgi:hypothetical protein
MSNHGRTCIGANGNPSAFSDDAGVSQPLISFGGKAYQSTKSLSVALTARRRLELSHVEANAAFKEIKGAGRFHLKAVR